MTWYLAAVILFAIAILLVILTYVLDRRQLKKKTSAAMSRTLWKEISDEREASLQRRDKFQSALHQAQSKDRIPRRTDDSSGYIPP